MRRMLLLVVFLSVVVGIAAVSTAQSKPPRGLDPGKQQVVDLRPILKDKTLNEGLNLVHTLEGGIKVSARVKNGEVTDWVFTDVGGGVIPSTYYKKRGEGPDPVYKCYRCIFVGKSVVCTEIPCPKHTKVF